MMILVPLSQIEDNPFQKRQIYDDIEELAADILSHKATRPDTLGLQQVPNGRVVGFDDNDLVPVAGLEPDEWLDGKMLRSGWRVQLEFGHRRKRAFEHLCHKAGLHEFHLMPVFIRDLTDDQMLDGVWSENRQRRNLSAVEEAELLRDKLARLQANGGGSQRDLAEAWGLARPTVANRLSLLDLPEEIKQANREGKLSERQCLALKTVVKVQQAVAGQNWNPDQRYYPPTEPDKYIAEVIEKGDEVTSDQIRQYTERALQHAGKELPKAIANFNFAPLFSTDWYRQIHPAPKMKQFPSCRGCPFRINDTCLDTTCLNNKKELYGQQAARAAAEELGLPCSDDPAHFSSYLGWKGADERSGLEAVYKAGVSDQVVVGYALTGDQALRPFHDSSYVHGDPMWDDQGKALVILGHKSPITRDLLAQAQAALADNPEAAEDVEIEDIPEKHEVQAWEKRAGRIVGTVTRRAKAAVLEAMSYEIAGSDVLQALLCAKSSEWLDPEAFRKRLCDYLWKNGMGVGYAHGREDEIREMASLLDRAGIGRSVLWESEAERLEAMALIVLTWWYDRRNWTHGDYELKKAAEKIEAVQDEFEQHPRAGGGHDTSLATWSYELGRVLLDVRGKLAQVVETAKNETPIAVTCDDCGDDFDDEAETAVAQPGYKLLLPELAYDWLAAYTDDKGRTWRDLEDNQVHHANSPCYQAFVKEFPNVTDPKLYLKQALARLKRETAVAVGNYVEELEAFIAQAEAGVGG